MESWYTYPDKTLPADEPYTFMDLLDQFAGFLAEKLTPTGIPDEEPSGFGIYPNPAGSFFRIRIPMEADVSLKIYSLTGGLLDSRVVSGNQVVSHTLKNGIYLLYIGNRQRGKVFRLVIRRGNH